MNESVIRCKRCGANDATAYFGASCSKCESPRPEIGVISGYCKDQMHFHCQGEFDWDCGCGCHEYFDAEWGMRKPMTEEYFFEMVHQGKLEWIQLTHIMYDPSDYNRKRK